jgi:hypothetical protein
MTRRDSRWLATISACFGIALFSACGSSDNANAPAPGGGQPGSKEPNNPGDANPGQGAPSADAASGKQADADAAADAAQTDGGSIVPACVNVGLQVLDQGGGLFRESFALDKDHGVFYSASLVGAEGSPTISVRYSNDGGKTWHAMADLPGIAANKGWLLIRTSPAGNVYLHALGVDAASQPTVFVWKTSGPQSPWTVLEASPQGNVYQFLDMYADAQEDVYLVGELRGAEYGWITRKSTGGAAFVEKDRVTGGVPEAFGVTADPRGNLYVAGAAFEGWMVRKSGDNGPRGRRSIRTAH